MPVFDALLGSFRSPGSVAASDRSDEQPAIIAAPPAAVSAVAIVPTLTGSQPVTSRTAPEVSTAIFLPRIGTSLFPSGRAAANVAVPGLDCGCVCLGRRAGAARPC